MMQTQILMTLSEIEFFSLFVLLTKKWIAATRTRCDI